MKTRLLRFAFSLIVSGFTLLSAQVPRLINYQGILSNPNTGERLSGAYSITFSIYATETVGAALWSETQSVIAQNGIFNVLLGNVNPLSPSLFNGDDRYLGVKVGNDEEMMPRKKLVSVGYAMKSYNSDKFSGKDTSQFVQAGQRNSIISDMIQENAITADKISPPVVSSINGVTNDGGNIHLQAGDNVIITPDDNSNIITISATAGAGNITSADIIDEPGIARNTRISVQMDPLKEITNLTSQAIRVPAAGYVVARGYAFAHIEAEKNPFIIIGKPYEIGSVMMGITTSYSGNPEASSDWCTAGFSRLTAEEGDVFYGSLYVEKTYKVNNAGRYWYYLNAKKNHIKSGNTWLYCIKLLLTYYPTSYGDVTTTSASE